jgi:hypothetical protein
MASGARHISRDPSLFGFLGLVRAVVESRVAQVGSGRVLGDDLTARAIAGAGLAALSMLPLLLLSSVLFAAPLAVPAAIGVCYLAVSRALSGQRVRRANLINSGILLGLIGWLIGFLLTGEEPLSYEGLLVALMAPAFAAAPAVARLLIARRTTSNAAVDLDLRRAASTRVADLETLTPAVPLLVLDQSATVLAASQAARTELGLLPDAFEHALAGLLNPKEVGRVLEAIGRCRREAGPISLDLTFETIDADKCLRAMLSPFGDGSVAMRIRERDVIESRAAVSDKEPAGPARAVTPSKNLEAAIADIGEAAAFALQHSSRKSKARALRLTSDFKCAIAAECDRQVARRIARLLIGAALDACEVGGAVHVETRPLKGVALLRTITSPWKRAMETATSSDNKADMTALQALVDGVGGTLVIAEGEEETVASVRLPLAPLAVTVGEAAA